MRAHFEAVLENNHSGDLWAIVLAGGDGVRLAEVCRAEFGVGHPKQFCALMGDRSLLGQAVQRVGLLVGGHDHIVVSSTRRWRSQTAACLSDMPEVRAVHQPSNRGTTAGLLAALLDVLAIDPGANVVVVPADHWFSNPTALAGTTMFAAHLAARDPTRVVLLGAQLSRVEEGLGWMETRPSGDGLRWLQVHRFVEKPCASEAARLHQAGALANTMIMVARATTLTRLVARGDPQTWSAMVGAWGREDVMEETYRHLPGTDVSRTVLAAAPQLLRTLPLMGAGWTDLGDPSRLARVRSAQLASHPPDSPCGEV